MPNCCRSNTSTSCSPCLSPSRPSPIRTRHWCTTCCSRQRRGRCARSPPIPSAWAPRSPSSPSCTPGARACCITRICPLRRARRRHLARRHALNRVPARVLPAGARPVAAVPPLVPRTSARGVRPQGDQVLQRHGVAAGCPGLRTVPGAGGKRRVGGLRQGPVRRARAGSGVPGALHAPGGDRQQPPVDFIDGSVGFRWKDYRHEGKPSTPPPARAVQSNGIFCLPDAEGHHPDGHRLRAASARRKTLGFQDLRNGHKLSFDLLPDCRQSSAQGGRPPNYRAFLAGESLTS